MGAATGGGGAGEATMTGRAAVAARGVVAEEDMVEAKEEGGRVGVRAIRLTSGGSPLLPAVCAMLDSAARFPDLVSADAGAIAMVAEGRLA